MLVELRVEHLGVIEDLSLVLGSGMTALTGETGAGKTLVVEAIELLVGGRADPALVGPGAAEARVEGRFVRPGGARADAPHDAGDGEGAEVVLARVVPREGRSRAYRDGRLATAASLAEEATRLVDLHGQHAHQSLLAPATQRAALDRAGSIDLGPLQAARARRRRLEAELDGLGGDERARAREIDLLRFQLDEIAGAQLDDPCEEAVLDAAEELLAGALQHREAGERALAALVDDGTALDTARSALAALGHRGPFEAVEGRLRGVLADLDDVAAELRAVVDGIEEDPERLAQVRARRQQLRDLCRKYGDDLAAVLAFEAETAARLAELEGFEERAATLDAARREALVDEAAAAAVVAESRRSAAAPLARAVQERLRALAMPKARVHVAVEGPDPADAVSFLLAANPGSPPQPLDKVASGGELARAMLALRLVLVLGRSRGATGDGEGDEPPAGPDTLVFDEVDSGVGGEAALAVGQALAEVAKRAQVLVVTHLAQVAAFADHHVVVRKVDDGGVTRANAEVVTGEARVRELSRMLSGLADSPTGRAHAEELLAAVRR